MAIRIVTDSSADLPRPVAEALDIAIVPLNIHFGSETFREGVDLTHAEFYDRLVREAPNLPKTSAPSVGQFTEAYEPILAEGDDIISIHLSAALSGTFNVARLAVQEWPEGRVTVVDSRNVSMCLGWTAIAAAEAAMRGEALTDILTLVADVIPRLRIPSFLETLAFVRYGGRIGGAEAFLGTLLNVKPILHIEGGKVVPLEKVRTRARALDRLMDLARGLAPFEDLAVMHTHASETAEALADRLGELHPRQNILIAEAGVAMGSHVGPGAVGICAVISR
ncbi:MAG: DegV family protein [Ardenticatenaceae bacterium]|nr:DegV family protein [Ardenticatenaceae bacterium]HBY98428.1 DegV family protein [Chloroflexota bacterium]